MIERVLAPLLPEGFYDLLYTEVEREQALEQALLSLFSSFGYRRIAPSLVEYEESLLAQSPSDFRNGHCFRVVDAPTQRMMAIRCDMTMQAARIASSRLSTSARPLRLCYAGTSLRTCTTAAKPHRQFSQLGCEIFGIDSPQADAEILTLAAQALINCEVAEPTIEIATPNLAQLLCEGEGLDAHQRTSLLDSFTRRSKDKLEEIGKDELVTACQSLLEHRGEARSSLKALQKISQQQRILRKLEPLWHRLEQTLQQLELPSSIRLTLDPIENRGFSYHETFAFTLLCRDTRGALGRGGVYRSPFDQESAIGCSFYLDSLSEMVKSPPRARRIYAEHNATRQSVEEHRAAGAVVVQALEECDIAQLRTAAEQNDCQALLIGNTLKPLASL